MRAALSAALLRVCSACAWASCRSLEASALAAVRMARTRSSTFSGVTDSVAVCSWRRSGLRVGTGELGGQVGAAIGGRVAFGCGDADVVIEAADFAVHLFAVVAPHRGVEAATGLVERQEVGR